MNAQEQMQRHLGNISRQVGHNVSNRYNYIVSQDELTNAYLQMRSELGYPLMIDSKYRRAIVWNKKGIEKKISDMIKNCIFANLKQLESIVAKDIAEEIRMQLQGIKQMQNGTIVTGKVKSSSFENEIVRFANTITKGVIKGVGDIVNDMTNERGRRR